MGTKDIDEKLRELESAYYKNWQRISFNLRKHLDLWSYSNVNPSWSAMKLSYWPVICNIGVDGSTASELSKKSLINKQNISRTIKELEEHGMIISRLNRNDKRSEVLELTEKGKELVLEANTEVLKINEVYSKLVGQEELETTITVLNKILDYHENMEKARSKNS